MKFQILKTLKQNKGCYVSGEELSSLLGVSRTAVWKNISALRKEGFVIKSSSRKGYQLVSTPDVIIAEEIQAELSTKIVGKEVIYMDVVSSTNTVAKEKAAQGYSEGMVIIADQQTAGKGRLGRSWESPPGTGIWLSIVLRPEISPPEAPFITILAALAVARALEKTVGITPGIKWPNDIVLEKAKVCGILTEMSAEMERINYIIVGIGINVNQDIFDFPEEIRDKATSVKTVVGHTVDRKAIVMKVLEYFEKFYFSALQEGSKKKLVEEYRQYSLTLGSQVKVICQNQTITGKALDITEKGELIVQTENGEKITVFSGEVSVRGLYGYI